MKKIISIISFLVMVLISFFLSSVALAGSEIYVGFIDAGTWDSKGSIFLEVNYKSAEAKKKCEILTEKLFQANKKAVFPVKHDSIKNYVNSGASDSFDVYTSKGYLGTYPISSYMLLTNECGGGVYPYIKLEGKIDIKTENERHYVIAHKKGGNKYKVLKNIDVKLADKNVKKILAEKNKQAKEKLKKIGYDTSSNIKKFTEKTDYSIYEVGKNEYFINCTWRFKWEDDEVGYCITNSFIVKNDKAFEVENFKNSSGDSIDVPNYVLAVRNGDSIFFVVEHEYYEGDSLTIIKLKNSKLIKIHVGNYFGC